MGSCPPCPNGKYGPEDKMGNPLTMEGFYRKVPSFLWGPALLAGSVKAASTYVPALQRRLASGEAVEYGWYDTTVYVVFAILMSFASHGWFCTFVSQDRQLQAYEPKSVKLEPGQERMSYVGREQPRGAAVRSTAALLSGFVYAVFPFGAPTTSWAQFAAWSCALCVYWDLHFFIVHKLVHEHRKLYAFVHKLHHQYKQPDVFGAYFVTYQSNVATEQIVVLLAAFCGLPRDVFTYIMFLGTLDSARLSTPLPRGAPG